MFSTGFSSGAREGRKIGVMFSGTSSLPVVCHPARSSSRTACAPSATLREISLRVQLHHVGCPWRRAKAESRSDPARRTNRAEQISVVVGAGRRAGEVSFRARPTAELGRSSGRSGPRPGAIPRPASSPRQTVEMSLQRACGKFFLNASTIRSSCAGWRGLALMWEKPSFFRSVPT